MVEKVQVGITTRCNSSCAFCLRTDLEKLGFVDRKSDMPIETVKNIIEKNNDVKEIQLCGNRGEAIFHPEIDSFIDLIKCNNKRFVMNTNGDRFDVSWWFDLGQKTDKRDQIIFAIDGLKEAHNNYRKTNFVNVLKNLKSFIQGGGNAVWQMILFRYNESQLRLIKTISKDIGCSETWIVTSRKYDEYYQRPTSLTSHKKEEFSTWKPKLEKVCMFEMGKKVYITIDGKVWPCCHMRCHYGFEIYPSNYFFRKAKEEENFIDVNNTELNTIVKESKLFKETFTNMDKIVPCNMYCGNPYVASGRTRKIIKN